MPYLCALLLLGFSSAYGQDASAPLAAGSSAHDPLSFVHLLKTFFALLAVCGLAILVLGALGKRFGRQAGAQQGRLRLIQSLAIDRDNRVLLLETQTGQQLLLGSAKNGVTLLGLLEDGMLVQPPQGEASARPDPREALRLISSDQ